MSRATSRTYHAIALALRDVHARHMPDYAAMIRACMTVEEQVRVNDRYAAENATSSARHRDTVLAVADALAGSPDFDRARFLRECDVRE